MKSTKLALSTVLLLGTLSACQPEPAVPVVEAAPAAVEPVAVAPAPVVAEPAPTTAPMTEDPADATGEDDDTPHSGGDKVGAGTGTGH